LAFELRKLFGRGNLSQDVRLEFDTRRGYARHHEACREALARPIPTGVDSRWAERGFARDRVVPHEECTELRLRIEASSAPIQRQGPAEVRRIDDPALLREVLDRALTPKIDQRLLQFFESEYVPYTCVYNQTRASADSQRSFLWHCDKGPSASAKLLLNLTSASDTGGRTDVIDREETEAFDRAGYVFQGQDARQEDLTDFAAERGLSFKPRAMSLEAGEGLCFLPRHVLHRGVPPSHGTRCMLALVFLPSPVPWSEAIRRLEADSPPERDELDWARDAELLTRRMQQAFDAD
jgi:hypothetical protein